MQKKQSQSFCLVVCFQILCSYLCSAHVGTTNRTAWMNNLMDINTQAKKKRQLSPNHVLRFLWLPTVYPTASAISHTLSVLCRPHTQGSGPVGTKTHSFSVTSLSLKSNACGTRKTSFISKLSFPMRGNEQNGVGQLAVTTFQDCSQAPRGAES